MFNIRIISDETICNEDVPGTVEILCINSVKTIGCLLDNKNIYNSHYFYHKYGVPEYWFIFYHSVKQKPKFDFQKHLIHWILNDPWYNTVICSRFHGSVFKEFFTTSKRDKYTLICSSETHEKIINRSVSTNLQMVRQVLVIPDHFH